MREHRTMSYMQYETTKEEFEKSISVMAQYYTGCNFLEEKEESKPFWNFELHLPVLQLH